jgi:hypothetical protein
MLFTNTIQLEKYSSQDISYWKKTNVISLYVKIINNNATFENIQPSKYISHSFIDRMNAIKIMINDTLLNHKINDLEILINVMDNPINNPYLLHFSSTTNCNVNTIPNFSFYNWTDAKSKDFYITKNDILQNTKLWEDKEDIIMWSGINSSSIRNKLNAYIQEKKDTNYFYNLINNYESKHTFVELKDHCNYKYLLDMEGIGYSGRFPYLGLTGSCVIILENEDLSKDYKLYYNNYFIENTHYLKVTYNNDTNIEDIDKEIKNVIVKNDCKKIAEECQNLSIQFFTKENITVYMSEILNHYSNLYINDNTRLHNKLLFHKQNIKKNKFINFYN